MNSELVGKTIYYLRKKANLTQKQLADKLNVTDKAVSRWERGIGLPDISLLNKLAFILDLDIESMLSGLMSNSKDPGAGLLVLNYPEGIRCRDYLYTKRIIYFQLCQFLLAGIKNICIRGCEEDIEDARSLLEQHTYLNLTYDKVPKESLLKYISCDYFKEMKKQNIPLMVIDSLFFLYGKDIGSVFTKSMYENENMTIYSNSKNCDFIKFYTHSFADVMRLNFARGVIYFKISNIADLHDASSLVKIIENQQKIDLFNMKQIADTRNMLTN